MTVRRRVERLRAVAHTRGVGSGPRVWAVLPSNDRGDVPAPSVHGSVVIVPNRWSADEVDAYLARLSGGRPDKVVHGIDLDRW